MPRPAQFDVFFLRNLSNYSLGRHEGSALVGSVQEIGAFAAAW